MKLNKLFFAGWEAERLLETAERKRIRVERGDRLVYLPTQEQLQKEIDLTNYAEFRIRPKLKSVGSLKYYFEMGYNRMHGKDFSDFESRYVHGDSVRELWLAFVMYERYNKFWDEEEWKYI